jgi:large conductance mechanosensitive channel
MAVMKEFKEFALRGNVVDMAIGVVIGAAFGRIVSSLVADVFTPILGKLVGDINFTSLFVTLSSGPRPASLELAKEAGIATLNYGVFLQAVFDFTIVAFILFLVIKGMNRLARKAPPATPTTHPCPECLSEIPRAARRCAHCTAVVTAAPA